MIGSCSLQVSVSVAMRACGLFPSGSYVIRAEWLLASGLVDMQLTTKVDLSILTNVGCHSLICSLYGPDSKRPQPQCMQGLPNH